MSSLGHYTSYLRNVSIGLVSLGLLSGCQPSNTQTNKSQNTTDNASNNAINTAIQSAPQPASLRIAAAANLSQVLPQIITAFQQQNPTFSQKIEVSYASSGKLYTQITQNAPYDIFLAANQEFPTKLVQASAGKYGKPFTYTQGQLALYSTTKALDKDAVATLKHYFATLDKTSDKANTIKLAIANPELAPYGKSAQSWLDSEHLTAQVKDHMVMGDNIEQAFTFVTTGNADFGLVAASQLLGNPQPIATSQYLILPANSYPAIKQDGVILHTTPEADSFIKFLLSPHAQAILVKSGYLPVS